MRCVTQMTGELSDLVSISSYEAKTPFARAWRCSRDTGGVIASLDLEIK